MNALKTITISKSIKEAVEKTARKDLSVGTHAVDFSAHFKGTVTVGADYEAAIVQKAEPWGLLELALSKLNGVTIDSIVAEHLAKFADTDDEPESVKALKDSVKNAIATIKGSTVGVCKGKVTTKLEVTF